MGSTAVEKTEEDLRNEISKSSILRQQRQITERLRDPRGIRRPAFSPNALRQPPPPFIPPGNRNDSEDQPPAKRPLSSAVVKLPEDADAVQDGKTRDPTSEGVAGTVTEGQSDRKPLNSHQRGWPRRDSSQRSSKMASEILLQNMFRGYCQRMRIQAWLIEIKECWVSFWQLWRNSERKTCNSQEQRHIREDTILCKELSKEHVKKVKGLGKKSVNKLLKSEGETWARVAAKTEEKKLELLFLRWSEHHKRLSSFIRTKAEPPIYYLPNKPLDADVMSLEKRKEEAFLEWKKARREEVTEYQKQIVEQYLANVEKELERWQNVRNARKVNNGQNLQETMDKELDTHRLEHGPKKRKIPGGSNNEDDDDGEDINVGEDDMMDDELDDDSGRRVDETIKTEAGKTSADPTADADIADCR